MAIHVCLLLYISALGAFLFRKKPYTKSKNRWFVLFSFLAVFVVQSLRGVTVGLDTDQYVLAFHNAHYGLYSKRWEPIFLLLIRSTARMSEHEQLFLAAYSFLILLGLGIFIVENTEEHESTFWSVFLFVVLTQYFSTMNLLRQSLAMAVGCNIFTVLKRGTDIKRIIIAALLAVLTYMCHKSGIVLVLLCIPFFINVNKMIIVIEFLAGLSVYYIYPIMLRVFLIFLPAYARYIGGKLDLAGSSGVYFLFAAIEVFIMILYLIYINPEEEKNQTSYRELFIVLMSFALIVLQRRISLAMRLGYYFELFLILLIPEFVSKWSKTSTRIVMRMGLYGLGWAYYIYSMTVSNARGCVPYKFFWQ